MSLRWNHVTIAQRVMVPAHIFLTGLFGYAFTFEADSLRAFPAYQATDAIIPLQLWGLGCLLMCAAMLLALVTGKRELFVGALSLLAVWMLLWTAVLLKAWGEGVASVIAWGLPMYATCGAVASMLTLLAKEV